MEQSDVSAEAEVEQHFADRPFEDCRPGRRLDTLHIHKLPIRCFKAPGLKGPSAEQIASVFGQFGGLVRFQVVQTGADGSLNFQLYLQYVEPIVARAECAWSRVVSSSRHSVRNSTRLCRYETKDTALQSYRALSGRKLAQPLKAREFVAELKVDVDRTG